MLPPMKIDANHPRVSLEAFELGQAAQHLAIKRVITLTTGLNQRSQQWTTSANELDRSALAKQIERALPQLEVMVNPEDRSAYWPEVIEWDLEVDLMGAEECTWCWTSGLGMVLTVEVMRGSVTATLSTSPEWDADTIFQRLAQLLEPSLSPPSAEGVVPAIAWSRLTHGGGNGHGVELACPIWA